MTFKFNKNTTKTTFKSFITRKHNQFKRFKKAFANATTPNQVRFYKNEAVKVAKQLKKCSKQWKNAGFGSTMWITKNYNVTSLTSSNKSTTRKNTRRYSKNKSVRSRARKTTRWTSRNSRSTKASARRNKARRTNRTSAVKSFRSYVAW